MTNQYENELLQDCGELLREMYKRAYSVEQIGFSKGLNLIYNCKTFKELQERIIDKVLMYGRHFQLDECYFLDKIQRIASYDKEMEEYNSCLVVAGYFK